MNPGGAEQGCVHVRINHYAKVWLVFCPTVSHVCLNKYVYSQYVLHSHRAALVGCGMIVA